jgi:urease accessory protein
MWILLQLADSAFPTGSFAHSAGLEAAAQAGEVEGRDGVARFARDAIWQAGWGALPLVRAAFQDPSALPRLDARAETFLVNHVANRASRTQGRAFLSTAVRVFPEPVGPVRAHATGLKLHFAPLWGVVWRALGLRLEDAQRVLLWSTARNLLSAAVRLGLVGTHEAQALLAQLGPLLDEVCEACGELDVEDLAQPAPLADLLQGTHDRLYSRLFQS